MVIRVGGKPLTTGVELPTQEFFKGSRRVERGDPPRAVQFVAYIMEPDNLAVRRVQKRHVEGAESERVCRRALRVPLSLSENVLRPQAHFLGLDDAEDPTAYAQGVIGGPVLSLVLFDRMFLERGKHERRVERHDIPARSTKLCIDA